MQGLVCKGIGGNRVARRGNIANSAFVRTHHFADNRIIEILRVNANKVFPRGAGFSIEHQRYLTSSQNAINEKGLLSPKFLEGETQIDDNTRTAHAASQTMHRDNRG